MNKTLKRFATALAAGAITISMLGCTQSGGNQESNAQAKDSNVQDVKESAASGEENTPASGGENASASGAPSKGVIGFNYFAAGDYALDTLANNTSHVIEACGYEAMSVCDNASLDQLVTDVENMINAGVDGLVLWIPNDSLYLSVADLCENAGVPFVLSDKVPTDPAIREKLETYSTYCGAVTPDNYSYGVQMAEFALDSGYKSGFILAPGVGDATGTVRINGFKETFEAAGGTVLGEQHTDDSNQAATQAEDMYLANPDADFIMATGASTFGSAGLEVLNKYNDSHMKIITADFDEAILASMKNDDKVSFLIGDFLVSGSYAAALMCNKLDGTPILDEDGTAPYIDNVPAYSIPVEQIDLFSTYIAGDCIYSDEECVAMLGMSLEEFENTVVSVYSLNERLLAKYNEGTIPEQELLDAGIEIK